MGVFSSCSGVSFVRLDTSTTAEADSSGISCFFASRSDVSVIIFDDSSTAAGLAP